MLKRSATAALVAGLFATSAAAQAPTCGDRNSFVAKLDTVHNEALVASGLHDGQHLVELWASRGGGTWTLLLSRADGFSCILGAGSAWSTYDQLGPLAGIEH